MSARRSLSSEPGAVRPSYSELETGWWLCLVCGLTLDRSDGSRDAHCAGSVLANTAHERTPMLNVEAVVAERERLRATLEEAIELAAEGCSYTSDYFREKWEMDERLEGLRWALASLSPSTGEGTEWGPDHPSYDEMGQ